MPPQGCLCCSTGTRTLTLWFMRPARRLCATELQGPIQQAGLERPSLYEKLNPRTERALWRGQDSNLRPLGYGPSELPSCSTPRCTHYLMICRSAGGIRTRICPG